ncbi:YcaO-like family protein [Desulfovibrio sp. JC010]|uniref:YcaO-like family protein n=1 Tax=Desulfovibrio sp. JC010 TaxID=2593641 RepID=UPI0013D86813|nr:YcaO-like family protein [Desulfovibrio sp. JC010]NDV27674.1 hypothetical protein [Desulfovibrio sp. JC010]
MNYRGKEYSARKNSGRETPRYMETEQVLELIRPTLKRIGVTSLSNFTNMDRIGIPVAIAVRPASTLLSVSFGKGLSKKQAMVSAAMENIERYAGTETQLDWFYGTYREVEAEHTVIPEDQLLLCRESFFHKDLKLRWTLGWDIVSKQEVAVPLSQATLLTGRINESSMYVFQSSSNGLAAGVHFAETVAQGLTEVIERDALACHGLLSALRGVKHPLYRVDLKTIPYPLVRDVLEKFRTAGVECMLFDCTAHDLKIPTYTCQIFDKKQTHTGMAMGYGANLNPETAMLRSMTESVLGRSEAMQGVRENFFPDDYQFNKISDSLERKEEYLNIEPTTDGNMYADRSGESFHGDIETMVNILKAKGFEQVIVLDMTPSESDVPVVRVIVPGLEGCHDMTYSCFGKRAYEYVREVSA